MNRMSAFENDTLQTLLVMKTRELREAADSTDNEKVRDYLRNTASQFDKLFSAVSILDYIDMLEE